MRPHRMRPRRQNARTVIMSEPGAPQCPALAHGKIAACHFCALVAGGPSELCLKMLQVWKTREEKKRAKHNASA